MENNSVNDEIEFLKKKVKKLENELESVEDDRDDLKQKLRQKEKESSLSNNEEYDKLKKEYSSLLLSKQDVDKRMLSTTQELDRKKKSIDFMHEIFRAENRRNESESAQIENNITKLYNFVTDELQPFMAKYAKDNKTGDDFSQSTIKRQLDRWAAYERKVWIKNKTSIAFVGEFSAGKTSIVNRILSQDRKDVPLLPVSTKATTAIPTYISDGDKTKFSFLSPDGALKKMREETFKSVNKEILDEIDGVSSLISYFIMEYNNENLRSISILDTPGFSSNDAEDRERTISVINECDALFWIFDVNAGTVNKSSIDTIKKHLRKPLHVVINKVDTKSETEVRKVEEQVKKTLYEAGLNVYGYHRFSSKADLSSIMDPIRWTVKSTNEEKTFIKNFGDILKLIVDNKVNEIKEIERKIIDRSYELEQYKSNFEEYVDDVYDFLNGSLGFLEETESFWSGKYYKMSAGDIEPFMGYLNAINERVQYMNHFNEQMVDASKERQELLGRKRSCQEEIREAKHLRSKLESLMKNLNYSSRHE